MALPLSGTHIAFLSGVPFSNDYKQTRYFSSESEQKSYFSNKEKVHLMTQASFQRSSKNVLYVRVNKNIDQLRNANYMYFNNTYPDGKVFYAFITDLEYVNDKLTHVYFELDVFQTWLFDIKFQPSFVVREHRPQYYSDGKPVINTVDEGLDYGTDYETVGYENFSVGDGFKFLVIVTKEQVHGESQEIVPSDIGVPQPLTYYFVPFGQNGERAEVITNEASGASSIPWNPQPISSVLKALYTDDSIVNEIVSLYVTEYFGLPFTVGSGSTSTTRRITFPSDNGYKFSYVTIGQSDGNNVDAIHVDFIKEFRPMLVTLKGDTYSRLPNFKESKLYMFPYSQYVLDDMKGNRFTIKPQYVFDRKMRIVVRGSMGLSNKVSYSVVGYNYDVRDSNDYYVGFNLESGIIDNNPNDVPIITDNLASYIQGNRNSLQNKLKQLKFNGEVQTIGALGGALGGIASKNGAQTGGSVLSGVSGVGNTIYKIQSIEAKGKDIDNTPPNIQSQGSNTSFDFGNGYSGFKLLTKVIRPEYQRKLTDFFNMFGYKYNEVKVPNMNTRKYWNYVQTEDCIILGDFDQNDLLKIRDIFNNGITLWHTDDVGNYSLNNVEV